ncbi:hypothetical protein P691DRAFT_695060 [Macrolepiota fuliginosa MF-IS2]|uniref:BTB domain-containing protein n=1 Tax=Macrolepiota fuliginosa MF-IS2 TaxID=1400762 RepID=A0A9P6C9N8_9AGAR|nr:hypothetical protein P691DRAFT_695060 [Macrolepiota fuliginosa MF-IS2]
MDPNTTLIADPTNQNNDVTGVSDDPPKPIVHNQSFYFKDDPMAVFLVKNQLFKVHRHFLIKESEVFRNMFASPKAESTATEGTCDEQPILIPGVTVEEFETLLEFLYSPPHVNNKGTANEADAQKRREVNLRLLSISHRFLFDDIFKYVASQLPPQEIPVLERIRLGDKYRVQTWLSSAYEELLSRPEPLDEEEADALGISRVVCFIRAKEDMHRERLGIADANCKAQCNRAAHVERSWINQGFTPLRYPLPLSPTPVPIHTVVEKYFPEI